MTDKLLAWVRREGLFPPGSLVNCAVSGGADSMAMLVWLLEQREALDIQITVLHFNHCLRGAESDGDEAYVRSFCEARGVPFHSGRGDAAAQAKLTRQGLEDAARMLRYAWLESFPGLIATAHTAEDNAETVLMNLIRGSGMAGLSGIPPKRGRIVRPVLPMTHEAARAFLQERNIPWREDSTNAEDDCRRNRLRHHVLPLLTAENPAFPELLLRNGVLLREENECLNTLAHELLDRARGPFGLRCEVLREAPPALLRRTLRLRFPFPLSMDRTEALCEMVHTGNGIVQIPGAKAATFASGILLDDFPSATVLTPRGLSPGETIELPELSLRVSCGLPFRCESVPPFQPDRLLVRAADAPFTVTSPAPEERILYAGRSRSLEKLLSGRKLPRPFRRLIPVLRCEAGIAAVYSIGDDSSHVPVPGEQALLITFTNYKQER